MRLMQRRDKAGLQQMQTMRSLSCFRVCPEGGFPLMVGAVVA